MKSMQKHGIISSQTRHSREKSQLHVVLSPLLTDEPCINSQWPDPSRSEQIRAWMWARGEGLPSMKSGIILEYMWHILFGKPAYWCPPARDCYCGTWNICNLDCDDEKGWCKGRIWTPDPPSRMPVSHSESLVMNRTDSR